MTNDKKKILLVFVGVALIALCILVLSLSISSTKLSTTPIAVTPTVGSVLNPSPDSLATFTGNASYNGYDKNGDGFYDYLKVDAEIEVGKAGKFSFFAYLNAPNGDRISWGGLTPEFRAHPATIASLKPNIQHVSLYFDGNTIRYSGKDGPYIVTITMSSGDSLMGDTIHFTTNLHNRRDFWYEDQDRCDYSIQMLCRLLY